MTRDASDKTVVLTFRYRLLPTKRQHAALSAILESQRVLYNAALEHRIGAYRAAATTITLYTQMAEITELRKDPAFAAIPANIQRWTLCQLDKAYQAFFRRVKDKGARAGFPRFRSKGRWASFGFAEFSGIRIIGKRLFIKGVPGGLRTHLHRPLPEARPISCTFTRNHKGWHVGLQYRVPVCKLPATGRRIGVDVGLTRLATLSSGEFIPNPRVARRAEKELRRRQRAVSRCQKGSKGRTKARLSAARLHTKIKNSRNTALHQVTARLVREFDLIAVEKLNVKGLASGPLAKSVNDAAWSKLREMLAYKAEWAGRQFVEVDPRHTSQDCSGCGCRVPKKLSDRWHVCPECGLEMDRDHNAALNVLYRAVSRPGLGNVGQKAVRSAGNITLRRASL